MMCTALILVDFRWLRIIRTRRGIKAVQGQNIVFHGLLKPIPWMVMDRLVEKHEADRDPRALKAKSHLIAMLFAQMFGLRSLRDIETNLLSHAGKLYHLGGKAVSKSALGTANASRAVEVFGGVLSALMAQLERISAEAARLRPLIDSTGVRLSGLATIGRVSAGVCGAKAHIIYDRIPTSRSIVVCSQSTRHGAKAMPIEVGATYVFDLAITTMAGGRGLIRPAVAL